MSIKSKVLVSLTIVCILLVSFTVVLAKEEPTYIQPFVGVERTVSSKDEVIIRYGWGACSKGLVNDYIDATSHVFYLDGVLLSDNQNLDKSAWGLPYEGESGSADFCLWDVDKVWLAFWEYSLGKLKPGDHELVYERTIAFPIIDGGDWDGDGMIDAFQGVTYSTTIIHVTP